MQEYQCITTRTGAIQTRGGVRPVLILELEGNQGSAIKFFNAKLTAKKNLSVPRNSDFAKLYRISLGENPRDRFSRANSLLVHFVGIWFFCETKPDKHRKTSEIYQKVIRIKPKKIYLSGDWTASGAELKKRRKLSAKSHQTFGEKSSTSQQDFDNDSSIFRQ